MEPDICDVVSRLCYNKTLVNGPLISARAPEIPAKIFTMPAFQMLKTHSIVVYGHNALEEKVCKYFPEKIFPIFNHYYVMFLKLLNLNFSVAPAFETLKKQRWLQAFIRTWFQMEWMRRK